MKYLSFDEPPIWSRVCRVFDLFRLVVRRKISTSERQLIVLQIDIATSPPADEPDDLSPLGRRNTMKLIHTHTQIVRIYSD